jgi:5-methylcytosine-specific restriction enzyme A
MDAWKRSHPLCLGCSAIGRVTATQVTDHVVPHKGDRSLLWSAENWQPSCREHHDVIKQRLELMFASGAISADALKLDSAIAVQLTLDVLAPNDRGG